jgi:hypothetical protein
VLLGSCHDTGLEAVITVVKEANCRRGLRGEAPLTDEDYEYVEDDEYVNDVEDYESDRVVKDMGEP